MRYRVRPRAKAGLTTTDVLETINGVATRDMPLAFAELLLQGDPGTTVEVGVLRFRKPEPQKLTLTRAMIQYPAVTAKMMPDEVGVVEVESLEGQNVKDVAAKIEDLQKQGAKRLVLDLRHCATGGPEEGAKLANLFLDKGLITYTEGQKVPRQDIQRRRRGRHYASAIGGHGQSWHGRRRGSCRGGVAGRQARRSGWRADLWRCVDPEGHHHGRWVGRNSVGGKILFAEWQSHPGHRRHAFGRRWRKLSRSPSMTMAIRRQPSRTSSPPARICLLKKAIEVVTKGKTDMVSAPQRAGIPPGRPAAQLR